MEGDKNKHAIWALLLSLLAFTTCQQNYHNNQLVAMPNEMVGLSCRDQPLNDPPLFLSFFTQYQDLPSEGSLHGARIFLVLGSSYLSVRKILVLGRSQLQEQVQPFACKPNTENIWRQDDQQAALPIPLHELAERNPSQFSTKHSFNFDEEETHDIKGTEGKSTGFLYKQ